jgi:heme exporter protein D
MNWGGWQQFWAMGGYGFYVWGAYGVTALTLALEVWALARRARKSRAAQGGAR